MMAAQGGGGFLGGACAVQATARAQSSATPRLRLRVPRPPRGGFFAGAPMPCGMVRLASAAGFGAWPPVLLSMARAGGLHGAGP
jgi:hypothetical protein